jgi:hypothetical protein
LLAWQLSAEKQSNAAVPLSSVASWATNVDRGGVPSSLVAPSATPGISDGSTAVVMGMRPDQAYNCPVVETLIARRERWGISYIALRPDHLAVMSPVIARLT